MIALSERRRQQLDHPLPITCDIYLFVARRPHQPLNPRIFLVAESLPLIAVSISLAYFRAAFISIFLNIQAALNSGNRTSDSVATGRRIHTVLIPAQLNLQSQT
jgi:hypothetical protein